MSNILSFQLKFLTTAVAGYNNKSQTTAAAGNQAFLFDFPVAQ